MFLIQNHPTKQAIASSTILESIETE